MLKRFPKYSETSNPPFPKGPQSTNNKCPKIAAVVRAVNVPDTRKQKKRI
jgi:hypothetical protein